MLKQALSLAAAVGFGCAGAPAPKPETPESAPSRAATISYREVIINEDGSQIQTSLPLPSSHPAALICVIADTSEAAAAAVRQDAEAFVGRNPMTPPLEIFQADQFLRADGHTTRDCLGIAQNCEHFEATVQEVLAAARCPCPNRDSCSE